MEAFVDLQKRIWEASLLLLCSESLEQLCSRAGLVVAKLLVCESAHHLLVDEAASDGETAVLRAFAPPFKHRFLASGILKSCYATAQIVKVSTLFPVGPQQIHTISRQMRVYPRI